MHHLESRARLRFGELLSEILLIYHAHFIWCGVRRQRMLRVKALSRMARIPAHNHDIEQQLLSERLLSC